MAGVERRMLDRIGGEVARATTIVRFAPKSHFSPHVHGGGEEFIVLEGVFQDEHGDFAAGTYVRNPPTSKHTPGSDEGCVIFVKLWQFDPDDRTQISTQMDSLNEEPAPARPGVSIAPLYNDAREDVRVERWEPNAEIGLDTPGGIELLVLEGTFSEGGEDFSYQSWLRLPAGGRLDARAGPEGCKVWVKSGHLKEPPQPPRTA
jgi:anti-sigma factor ChrR (cupin superfamily)